MYMWQSKDEHAATLHLIQLWEHIAACIGESWYLEAPTVLSIEQQTSEKKQIAMTYLNNSSNVHGQSWGLADEHEDAHVQGKSSTGICEEDEGVKVNIGVVHDRPQLQLQVISLSKQNCSEDMSIAICTRTEKHAVSNDNGPLRGGISLHKEWWW